MADLHSLIRYRKHIVEQKQEQLSELYRQAEKLDQDKADIEGKITKEIEHAQNVGTVEAQTFLGPFLNGARKKIETIEGHMKQLDLYIAEAQEAVREAFAELKKVEITQRNRDDEEAADLQRKETQELDEIALDGYRRKTLEEEAE